jgi:hypothetical protein
VVLALEMMRRNAGMLAMVMGAQPRMVAVKPCMPRRSMPV